MEKIKTNKKEIMNFALQVLMVAIAGIAGGTALGSGFEQATKEGADYGNMAKTIVKDS